MKTQHNKSYYNVNYERPPITERERYLVESVGLKQENINVNTFKTACIFRYRSGLQIAFFSSVSRNKFNEICISSDGKLAAIIPVNSEEISLLLTENLYRINSFKGSKAHFSPDGKYLLIIDHNQAYLILVNPDDIIKITDGVFE